jgi:hypothetical protein
MRKKQMSEESEVIMVSVRLVEQRGESAVVEYDKAGVGLYRVIVPADAIVEDQASETDLDMGVPYGLPWESIAVLSATGASLANALRVRGIWTLADLERNQPAAFGAIQSVYGVDLAALIHAAETAAHQGA